MAPPLRLCLLSVLLLSAGTLARLEPSAAIGAGAHAGHPPLARHLLPEQAQRHSPAQAHAGEGSAEAGAGEEPDVWTRLKPTQLAQEVDAHRWADFVPPSSPSSSLKADKQLQPAKEADPDGRCRDDGQPQQRREREQKAQQKVQQRQLRESVSQAQCAPPSPAPISDHCAPQPRAHAALYSSAPNLGETHFDRFLRYSLLFLTATFRALRAAFRLLLLAPLRTSYRIALYGAGTTWSTTTWAGERAVWRPVRTIFAPVVFLIQGFTFLFVWTPYALVQIIVRELYPVYIFLGAALALGTSIGIGAAVVLYLGSFFFSDSAPLEQDLSSRLDEVRREVPILQSPDRGGGRKKKKAGLLEKSIRELERAREQQKFAGAATGWEEESEEEDSYFPSRASRSPAPSLGSGSASYASTPTAGWQHPSSSAHPLAAAAATARGFPPGATSRGGWGHASSRSASSSSSPALSPAATRSGLPRLS